MQRGYLSLTREWQPGDVVELEHGITGRGASSRIRRSLNWRVASRWSAAPWSTRRRASTTAGARWISRCPTICNWRRKRDRTWLTV